MLAGSYKEILFSRLKSLSKPEKIEIISFLTEQLKENVLPVFIFKNNSLSALETIVKYLKEEHNLSYAEISRLLNRSSKTIWITYQRAKKKMPKKLKGKSDNFIPARIFQNRKFSVLENLVSYLKQEQGISYKEIAKLINRNYRTVLTVYRRFRKKNE
ncbi:hypothetical protein COY26_04390 [Candidatus Woesearchaeota archaeon CG_4_10_14_0_2_um_filter_33_10]|nr:MAG: hypothetical protein COY26_04390 [Candidatus Woesearchaeota archaeon CG_4_10_14_0_2_um_filter_33_10]